MRTQRVGSVALDEARLRKDLDHVATTPFSEAYSNYLIGGPWKSWVLWSPGGDRGDGVMTTYDYAESASFTDCARGLPYLQELITSVADTERLNFVRLAMFSDSVIVPHRDYIELADLPEASRHEHRVHLPLVTHDECYFSDGAQVYRMRAGEVWFLDAAQVHAAASFVKEPRIHLIFDMVGRPSADPLLKVGDGRTDGSVPQDRVVHRPPLSPADRDALAALAGVLTEDTYGEVFSIVVKKHFRVDGGKDFAWRTMSALAEACADPGVVTRVREQRRYYELERSAEE
jgi:hypothetical protein